jgi:molybdopterin/thiamine biosynthesis adenylyltransferase
MKIADRKAFANEFFNRQIIMKEIGTEGQRKLAEAKVAVVGAGGLGTVSSLYLALAGVGYLRLIDQDTVEVQNLHRQILYSFEDLQYPKVEVAAEKLQRLSPLLKVKAVGENVNAGNVERLLAGVDCVVDGLDNMLTRYLLNRVCVKMKVPYVFGAAIGLEGNLSVFSPPETPCLECVMPNLSDTDLQTCDTRGVLGATPGIIGAMQAMETVKLIAGVGSPLKGKLMVCDFSDMSFASIDIAKNASCLACEGEIAAGLPREKLVWLCGRDTANINPEEPLKLNLKEVYETAKRRFNVKVKSNMVIVFDYKDFQVSLFSGGRMLIKNVTNEKIALKAYREIRQTLNLNSLT